MCPVFYIIYYCILYNNITCYLPTGRVVSQQIGEHFRIKLYECAKQVCDPPRFIGSVEIKIIVQIEVMYM